MILPSLVMTKEVGVDCGNKLKITFWILIGFPFRRSLVKTLPTVLAFVVVLSVVVTVYVSSKSVITVGVTTVAVVVVVTVVLVAVGVVTDCNIAIVTVAV